MNPKVYLLLLFYAFSHLLVAQTFKKPEDYLSFIKSKQQETAQEVIAFVEELEGSAHSRSIEAKRRAIVSNLKTAIPQLKKLPDYKTNHGLADSLVRYEEFTLTVFEKEYSKMVRLQDSATKSFAHERKYGLDKQAVLFQLINNESRFLTQLQRFGTDYVVAVPKKYEEEMDKLTSIQKVCKQHNVYKYVFVKCSNQEALLAKAIEFRKKTDMEEHSAMLKKFVKEGHKVLDTLQTSYFDRNIVQATRELLDFYETESEYKIPMLISFMSRGGEDQRKGKTDIGNNININPHVNVEPHADIATYANTKGDLDADRPVLISNWNKASQNFLKKYLPAL